MLCRNNTCDFDGSSYKAGKENQKILDIFSLTGLRKDSSFFVFFVVEKEHLLKLQAQAYESHNGLWQFGNLIFTSKTQLLFFLM